MLGNSHRFVAKIHTNNPQKKNMLKPVLEVQQISRFLAFFEWMTSSFFSRWDVFLGTEGILGNQKNPHCLPMITPIQVVCFNKHHTGVRRHIYIYIFIVYTYHIYIFTFVCDIYICTLRCAPNLKTYGLPA